LKSLNWSHEHPTSYTSMKPSKNSIPLAC